MLGGGFGRRANPASDFVVEAVEVAKVAKAPVKVVWTREDDLKGGWYRPMWHDRFVAAFDANGEPTLWKHTIVGQSIAMGTPFESMMVKNGVDAASVEGAADLIYGFPICRWICTARRLACRCSGGGRWATRTRDIRWRRFLMKWRTPREKIRTSCGGNYLVNQPRMLAVLDLAAKKANWGAKLAPGVGRGIAAHFSFESYVAQVIEASVEKNGTVRVHRVVCALDCGTVVNPDTVKAQIEGGVIFGLTAALKTEITLKDGRVEQNNFHDYQILRMFESPEIEVYMVPSTENPTGVGEPGVPCVAPALVNAIFAATGKRVRRLPIRTSDLV